MNAIGHFHIFLRTGLLSVACLLQAGLFSTLAAQCPGHKNDTLSIRAHRFYNKINAGVLMGDDKGLSIQTVIGYQFLHRFQAGAGVGIDGYTLRAVPVFAAFSADLSKRKTTPFVFTEAGAAFPWLMKKQYAFMGKSPEQNKTGPYLQVGVGQKWRIRDNQSIELSLAYSLEKIGVRYVFAPDNLPEYNYDYTFRRLALQLGFTL